MAPSETKAATPESHWNRILALLYHLRSECLEPVSIFQKIHIWMAMPGDILSPSCLQYTGDNSAQGSLSGMAGNPYTPWTSKASASTAFLYKVDCGSISRVTENNTTLLLQVQNAYSISPVSKLLKCGLRKGMDIYEFHFLHLKNHGISNISPELSVIKCSRVRVCQCVNIQSALNAHFRSSLRQLANKNLPST